MKQAVLMLLVSIGVWSSSCAQSTLPWSLSAERFQALRRAQGHFNGGAWNAEVDAWNGAKHQAMKALAAQAVEGAVPEATLREWMGPPDETVTCPSVRCDELAAHLTRDTGARPASPQGLSIYDWRGGHDRLVFFFAGGKVAAAGWWMAGE